MTIKETLFKYSTYVLIGFILLLVGFLWWYDYKYTQLQNQLVSEEEAHYQFRRVNDSTYTVAAHRVTSLEKEKEALKEIINKKEERLLYYSQFTVTPKSFIIDKSSVAMDSFPDIENPDVMNYRVSFEKENGIVKVKGYTVAPRESVNVEVTGKPVRLKVFITQTKTGFQKGFIQASTQDLIIEDWDLSYEPYKEPVPWIKPKFLLGVGPFNSNMMFIVGGGVKLKYLPISFGVLGMTQKGIGAFVSYP